MPIFECSRCNELTYSASVETVRPCPRCDEIRHRVLDGGFADARDLARDLAPGDHAMMLYDDPSLVAPFCCRYLTEGIDKGERVMAVAPDDLRVATEALLAADVYVLIEWVDPMTIYGNFDAVRVATMYDTLIGTEPRSMRILAVLCEALADGVASADFDRYECLAHDIVNRHGATAICLYDTRGLDPEFLNTSGRRHTLRVSDGTVRRNESFEFQPA